MPSLSIIVPVYNVEHYLEQCIQSILDQSYNDFELILIDDGSTDMSGVICDNFRLKDERISVVHGENRGQAFARNMGLQMACGKYLSFIDSDDWVEQGTFDICVKILDEIPFVSFVQYPYQNGEYYNKYQERIVCDKNELFRLWIETHILTGYMCDKIFRRSLFEDLKFPEGFIFEDRFIYASLLLKCDSIYFSQKGLYYYRTHVGQTVRRSRSPYFLESMIKADLNILLNMPVGLHDLYVTVYWRILTNFKEYLKKKGKKENLILLLKINLPSVAVLDKKIPRGIKMYLWGINMVGLDLYIWLMKFKWWISGEK